MQGRATVKTLDFVTRFVSRATILAAELDRGEDDVLDAMDRAYTTEHARWSYRYNGLALKGRGRWEIVRNSSPFNNIIGDEEIVGLTKRECSDRHIVAEWLDAYAGRAAMRAALKAMMA